ncbi:M28 family peptidase [Sphingosinicella sp. YJ22]|uniref:M28 family peptidase n=1 Tax=Sphingosinicella sp. YJ22 TaxID=1104780 RepID=UPI00140836B7|nr:M28 family peptidase [Sphingosinicella sp. YJ22]
MRGRFWAASFILMLAGCATSAPGPAISDAETRAWWAVTAELSNDAMEGRDTGSPGYDRAAALVVERWRRAGLRPAGDNGTWFQPIAMKEVRVDRAGTALTLTGQGARPVQMQFLHAWTVRPTEQLPASVSGALAFRGYCAAADLRDVAGKVVVCLNTRRTGAPSAGQQVQAAAAARAAAIIQVDNPYFMVEPPRWPIAYARSVSLLDAAPPAAAALPVIRWNAEWFGWLVPDGADDLLRAADRGEPVASSDPPARLDARFAIGRGTLSSPNVLGVLPGTDPALADEYVVVGAHLDGYGFGEPIDGDGLYNGTFDDAAYVATLIRLAEQRQGRGFRRPVLFAAFTGEEKGLIGSRWLVDHLPMPRDQVAAMINLDQLRPIFPLDLLTVHALDDTTLGEDARAVAEGMGIRVRLDPEPERNLLQRTDHWPFLMAGVPAINFVFGYEPGSDAERRYRLWYQTRYHHPGDDLTQPWDPVAAERFNRFFYDLVARVADADRRPAFVRGNPYRRR